MRQRKLKITVSTEMSKQSSRRDNQMKRRQRILKITVSMEMSKWSSHSDNQMKRRQRILKIAVSMEMSKQSSCSNNQTLRSEMSHNGSDNNGHLDLELQPNNSGQDHDDYKEMENKNNFPETPITNLDPKNELLNAKCNITSKKETKDRKRKSSRLAAKSKATENKEKEDRKRKSQTSPAKSNKKLKQEEMLDDGDILYKLPKQILQENQKSKVMSETDQLQLIMQAIYKRNPVPSNEDGNRWVCTVCNKTFVHTRSLNTHLKGHYQAGKYNCSFCGHNFVNKNEFQQHEERHRDEREYVCGKCHKGFNTGSSLKLHLPGCRAKLLGEAVQKLPCPECGKLFLNQPSLRTYARSHIDKYECLPCNKVYKQFTSLWRHNEQVHKKNK